MGDKSSIEWTEATWNPVTGCTRVSEGCENCYIDWSPPFRMNDRHFRDPDGERSNAIGSTTGVILHPDRLDMPLRWRRPRKVFVNSLSDLFHEDVPDGYIAQVFAVMALAPTHTFQVLTKRPARMRSLLTSESFAWSVWHYVLSTTHDRSTPVPAATEQAFGGGRAPVRMRPLPNVWLGATVENQRWADNRIPLLLDTPAAVRWLSCEPLLGPVDLTLFDPVDWVVAGGESGDGARRMDPDWVRSLRDQCAATQTPFLFKQAGSVLAREWGCSRKGTDPGEWPESFPRQYPSTPRSAR